jgi:hypothetical protein
LDNNLQTLNPMAASISSSCAKRILLLVGALLLGGACFLAGRFCIRQPVPETNFNAVSVSAAHIGNSNRMTAARASDEIRSPSADKTSGAWDEKQWSQLLAQPGTPARNAALTAMLEKLAAVDPDRAMALAKAEGNLKLRDSLTQATLRGWARLSPTNAAAWALALPDANARETALSSVFTGLVAADPAQAVNLGKLLIQQNPNEALGCGSRLVDALCDAGNFEAAVQLASGGDKEQRSFWLAGAYSKWAEFQPEQAAAAAAAITDPDLRNEALHGIVGGWAEADPVALVQFVTKLPSETDDGSILSQALQYWVKHDAAAASQWINSHESGPAMDEGVAAVAIMESIKPDVAVGWAGSIVNPTLRSETLATVIRSWMTDDLPAARQYFENTKDLLPEDRQQIAEALATLGGQSAEP